MRCFVAFDLPAPVRNHLANVVAPLRDRYEIRWVPPEQMHLTMLFGGELDRAGVDALCGEVEAFDGPAPSLSLDRLGAYPPRGLPRVVWAGLAGDLDVLRGLHAALEATGAEHGVAREKRGFSPHITLGRVKSNFGVLALLDQLEERSGELKDKPFAPGALTVYESRLTPRGPQHEVLLRRPLR